MSSFFLPTAGLLAYLLLAVTCQANQRFRRVTMEESKVTRYSPREERFG